MQINKKRVCGLTREQQKEIIIRYYKEKFIRFVPDIEKGYISFLIK